MPIAAPMPMGAHNPSEASLAARVPSDLDAVTALPAGWQAVEAEDGRTYYWNVVTDAITWTRPTTASKSVPVPVPIPVPVEQEVPYASPQAASSPEAVYAYEMASATHAEPTARRSPPVAHHPSPPARRPPTDAEEPTETRFEALFRAGHLANTRGDWRGAKRLFLEAASLAPAGSERRQRYMLSAANMSLKLHEINEAVCHYEALAAEPHLAVDVASSVGPKLEIARARLADRGMSPARGASPRLSPGMPPSRQPQRHRGYAQHYETLRETQMPADWRPDRGYGNRWEQRLEDHGKIAPGGYSRFRDETVETGGEYAFDKQMARPHEARTIDCERCYGMLATFTVGTLLTIIVLSLSGAAASAGPPTALLH